MPRALDVPSVIAGEAVSGTLEQRWNDMVHIASVIQNRAQQLGVSMQDVIANTDEFNAYNNTMPPGTRNLTDLAQQAIDYVAENGPVTNATFYSTPARADNLPSGLNYETSTDGHQYYSDPQGRAIGTALGYVRPNPYAYAANPQNVPVPTMQEGGLLSAFQEQQPASQSPFDAVMAPQQSAEWGVINGVGPVYTPTFNQWADMAAAQPVQAPMGSVQPAGLLSASPAQISQQDISRAFFNPTGQGQLDPSFSEGLMGPNNPVVPTSVSTTSYTAPQSVDVAASRFSTPPKTDRIVTSQTMTDTARMNPLTGAINPATNTQSFMDQPADLGSMPAAYAAQRGPSSGLLSADAQTVQGLAERNLQREAGLLAPNPALATPNFNQALSPTVPGLLGGIDYAPTSAMQQSSMAGLMASPEQQAAGYNQAAQSLRQAGIMNIGQQPPTDLSGNLPTNFNVLNEAAPALETITVAEQPTITDQTATIDGPTNTPAVQQQNAAKTPTVQQQAQQTATQPSLTDRISKAINPGTVAGGLIGSTLGPVGGLLGSLLGNSAYNGGLNGLLGSGFVAPTNQIAGGVNNIAGIYGGLYSPGTYAMASNGAQVSALGGGYTGYTNKYGVSEVISPTGQISHNFGSLFGNDDNEDQAA